MVRSGTLWAVKITGSPTPASVHACCQPARSLSRKSIDQQRMIVPALDEINREWKTGSFRLRPGCAKCPTVEPYAGPGVVRRKADNNRVGDAVFRHLAHRVGDIGLPVAHADVGRHSALTRDPFGLAQGDLGKRRAPDQTVAMLDFAHDRLGQRASAGYVEQIFRDIFDAIGAAVRQQQNGLPIIACTSAC